MLNQRLEQSNVVVRLLISTGQIPKPQMLLGFELTLAA